MFSTVTISGYEVSNMCLMECVFNMLNTSMSSVLLNSIELVMYSMCGWLVCRVILQYGVKDIPRIGFPRSRKCLVNFNWCAYLAEIRFLRKLTSTHKDTHYLILIKETSSPIDYYLPQSEHVTGLTTQKGVFITILLFSSKSNSSYLHFHQ